MSNLDDNGPGSLRDAIEMANETAGADTIEFDVMFDSPKSIDLEGNSLNITDTLTINGPGSRLLTIDAQGESYSVDYNSRVIDYSAIEGDLTIEGLTLTGGRTTAQIGGPDHEGDGSGLRFMSDGQLILRQVLVIKNEPEGYIEFHKGGGVFSRVGDVSIFNSEIFLNTSRGDYDAAGGGIFAGGTLRMHNSSVRLNAAEATGIQASGQASGGGLSASSVTVVDSFVSENLVTATSSGSDSGTGGGIAGDNIEIRTSTISHNSSWNFGRFPLDGGVGLGGGVSSRTSLTIVESSISNNLATGDVAEGGGLHSNGTVNVVRSLISGNRLGGRDRALGAGIFARAGEVSIEDSTLSGNSATRPFRQHEDGFIGLGGGIFAAEDVDIHMVRSTIVENVVGPSIDWRGVNVPTFGGGIYAGLCDCFPLNGKDNETSDNPRSLTIENSIIAENRVFSASGPVPLADQGTNSDIDVESTHSLVMDYSLIGAGDEVPLVAGGVGNLIGTETLPIPLLLGPLMDNGGATQTHALLPGSPAIDAGNPNAMPMEFDQRGLPFNRIADGTDSGSLRIDMGAYEAQTKPEAALGCDLVGGNNGCDIDDINALIQEADGTSALSNMAVQNWLQEASSATNPAKDDPSHVYVLGDANLDGKVDSIDLGLVLNNFGSDVDSWVEGDFGQARGVSSFDLGVLLNNFGFTSETQVAAHSIAVERVANRNRMPRAAEPNAPGSRVEIPFVQLNEDEDEDE